MVAYRSEASIVGCIEGLLGAGVDSVVVVDNSPTDDAGRCLRARWAVDGQPVQYVSAASNIGFGRAVNLGAALLPEAGYIVVANPDVRVSVQIGEITAMLEASNGCIGSGLLAPGCDNSRPWVSPSRELLRAVVGDRRSYGRRRTWTSRQARAGQLDGAFLVLRRDHFDLLGGFDERFELYYEDVDLGRRAEPIGGSWLLTEAVGQHQGGRSARANPERAYVTMRISRLRYLRKWWGAAGACTALVCAVLEVVTRTVTRAPEGDRARARAFRLQLAELSRPGSVWLLDPDRRGAL